VFFYKTKRMKTRILFYLLCSILFACNPQVSTEDNSMKIDSIIINKEQIENTVVIDTNEYVCVGTEPFYQIKISEKENIIDFYKPMEQDTIHFLFSKPVTYNGVVTFISTDLRAENKINIQIKNENCSDGMSEKQFKHSTEIMLNDKKYKGCALKLGEQ